MEYTEDINEWQQIEQHSLQIVPTTIIDPEDGATSSPSVTSSSVTDEEGATPMPPPLDWRLRVANEGKKLLKLRFEAMKTGVDRVASKVRNCVVCTGAFWSIAYVTGAAASAAAVAVLILFYVGNRSRRRRSVDHSVNLVREKDEKISQLLLQIAQLNEILSSCRKVPVHRIGS